MAPFSEGTVMKALRFALVASLAVGGVSLFTGCDKTEEKTTTTTKTPSGGEVKDTKKETVSPDGKTTTKTEEKVTTPAKPKTETTEKTTVTPDGKAETKTETKTEK